MIKLVMVSLEFGNKQLPITPELARVRPFDDLRHAKSALGLTMAHYHMNGMVRISEFELHDKHYFAVIIGPAGNQLSVEFEIQ